MSTSTQTNATCANSGWCDRPLSTHAEEEQVYCTSCQNKVDDGQLQPCKLCSNLTGTDPRFPYCGPCFKFKQEKGMHKCTYKAKDEEGNILAECFNLVEADHKICMDCIADTNPELHQRIVQRKEREEKEAKAAEEKKRLADIRAKMLPSSIGLVSTSFVPQPSRFAALLPEEEEESDEEEEEKKQEKKQVNEWKEKLDAPVSGKITATPGPAPVPYDRHKQAPIGKFVPSGKQVPCKGYKCDKSVDAAIKSGLCKDCWSTVDEYEVRTCHRCNARHAGSCRAPWAFRQA